MQHLLGGKCTNEGDTTTWARLQAQRSMRGLLSHYALYTWMDQRVHEDMIVTSDATSVRLLHMHATKRMNNVCDT